MNTDGNTYAINKYLDECEAHEERQRIQERLEEADWMEDRIEELEAELAAAREQLAGEKE